MLTVSRLKEVLTYAPDTGVFVWQVATALATKVGAVAGSVDRWGYRRISIDRRRYRAHHLAWLYVYGEHPKTLDHKNRDRDDNRIENLRVATSRQNSLNQGKRSGVHSSQWKGVSWNGRDSRWQARLRINGRLKSVGTFRDELQAALAYNEAAKMHHGEFAVLNEVCA